MRPVHYFQVAPRPYLTCSESVRGLGTRFASRLACLSLCGLDCGVKNSVRKPTSDHLGASTLVIGCYMARSGPPRLRVYLWHPIRERGLWMFGGRGDPTARSSPAGRRTRPERTARDKSERASSNRPE